MNKINTKTTMLKENRKQRQRWCLGAALMTLFFVTAPFFSAKAQMMYTPQNDELNFPSYYYGGEDAVDEPQRTGTTFYYQVLSNLADYSGEYIFARNAYNGMCSGLKAKDAAHTAFTSDYSYPTTTIAVTDYKITSGADDCVVIKIEKEASGYSLYNTTTDKYIDVATGGHLIEVATKPTEFWSLSYSSNMVTMRRVVDGTPYFLKNTYNVSPFDFNLSLTSANGGTDGWAPRIYKKTNVSYKTIPETTTLYNTTYEYRPFLCGESNGNQKSYTQAIYTPDEMNVSGTILSVGYNYYGTSSLKDSHVIDIYMAEIDPDYRFDGTSGHSRRFVPLSGQTKVYSGTITGWTSGWREITLTTPFEYSGDKALLVTVYKKSKTGSTDGDASTGFYYHDYGATSYTDRKFATANYAAVDHIIGHESDAYTSGVNASMHRPQIRFGMEAKLNIEAVAEDSYVTEVNVSGDGQTGISIKVTQGSEVTFNATLDDCRIFTGWYDATDALVSTDNPYVFTPTDDITLTAKSIENTGSYTITVTAGSNGSLDGAYSGTYTCGDQVTMSVTPDAGYSFSGWYDGTTFLSDENPFVYHVTGNANITAYFAPPMNISPASGTYAYGTVATMETTSGATIYYTTDGTTPSEDNYSGTGTSPLQFSLINNTVLKAVGKVNGSYTSIVTRNYVIPVDDYTGTNPEGLVLSKNIDDPANPSLLTLESYVTGKTITKTENTPVDVIFVMDFSSSMTQTIGSGVTRFNAMKEAVSKFLNVLKDNPSDYPEVPHRVAFVPFGEYGTLCYNSGSQYNPVLATAKSNKYKALTIPTSDISTSLYSKAFLNMVTPNAFGTGYVSNYTNVSNFWDDGNSSNNSVCDLAKEGWTYTHIGINVAEKILQNNSSYGISSTGEVINRKRIVIVLTDGGIGNGNWYYTTGECEDHCSTNIEIATSDNVQRNMSEQMANISLQTTYRIKNDQDATVYTFGIFTGADASGVLPSYNTTDYNSSMQQNCVVYQTEHGTAAVNNVNRHMHLLSSNYPSATCMAEGSEGTGSNAGYFMSPTTSSSLSSAFETIATNAIASMSLSSEAVVQDVIGDNFVLPAGTSVNNIQVYTAACTATSPSLTFATPAQFAGANVQISPDGKHIIVKGFNFTENWVGDNNGTPHGAKLIIKIPIAPDPNFQGVEGDYPTNADGSCVYDEHGNPVAAFTSPTAHLVPAACNDFETFSGTAYDVAGNLPTGWRGYVYADGVVVHDIVAPHIVSSSSFDDHGKAIVMTTIAPHSYSTTHINNNCAYVVMPAMQLSADNRILSFRYITNTDPIYSKLEVGYITTLPADDTQTQWAMAFNSFTNPKVYAAYEDSRKVIIDLQGQIPSTGDVYITFKWMSDYTYLTRRCDIDDVCLDSEDPSICGDLWTEIQNVQPASWTWSNQNDTLFISNSADLAWLISYVNGYNGCTPHDMDGKIVYVTTPMINMFDHVWVPIGFDETTPFKGTFDGAYNPLIGVHVDANSSEPDCVEGKYGSMIYAGMFGYTEGATIKNTFLMLGQEPDGTPSSRDWITCQHDGGYLGTLVAYGKSLNMDMCFIVNAIGAFANLNCIGGLVGYADAFSTIKASMANAHIYYGRYGSTNLSITNLGGLVGKADFPTSISGPQDKCLVTNCFAAPIDLHVKYANSSTPPPAAGSVDYKGAIVGNGKSVSNVYVHPFVTTGFDKVVGGGQATVDGWYIIDTLTYVADSYTSRFTPAVPRTYGSYSTNNTIDAKPLAEVLNQNVITGYKWITPPTTEINAGYPLIVRTTDTAMAVMASPDYSERVLSIVYNNVNSLLSILSSIADPDEDLFSVLMYSNGYLTDAAVTPSTTRFYIDENVAVKQTSNNNVTATVGITLDNSKGNGEMARDWHMFSTSLQAVPLGIKYCEGDQSHTGYAPGSDNYLLFGPEGATTYDYAIDANGYFPAGISDRTQFDFYSYYEPQYHWINLKRKPNNHWHEDEPHTQIEYTCESGQTILEKGKGYLVALGNKTTANNNFMQASGMLNNGDVTRTLTSSGGHLRGYNLIGNPYQSYLDFNAFAEANAAHIWSNDSDTGYMAYLIYNADAGGFEEYLIDDDFIGFSQGAATTTRRYLNMHQGFFVVKKDASGVDGAITFNNTMRSIDQTPNFRDEVKPTYPLVNLFCTDSHGKSETVIMEFERPLKAGSTKMKGMLNGKCNMYAHWGNDDLGSVFIDYMPDYVPVWFEAAEDGVFTITWNTANANFGYMHLIDHLTGTDYDCLAPGNDHYTFESHVNDMKARFRVVFKPLGIDEVDGEVNGDFAFFNGEELIVNGEGELSLIDVNGRVLTTRYVTGQQSAVALPTVAEGMYLLRLTRANDVKVQKIVIRK